MKSASIFQRHPFVITWWEGGDALDERDKAKGPDDNKSTEYDRTNASKARIVYVMIDPQRGWTRNVTSHESVFKDQVAWLDGPFGSPYRLEEYSTVVLFASGNGIFAQLPLLKDLASGLKASAIRTRRVKLVWQAESSNEQLQEWMHEILRDEQLDNDALDICIHAPMSPEQLEAHQYLKNHRIYKKSRCVKIVYDVPDVEGYLQRELKESRKSMAVTGQVVAGYITSRFLVMGNSVMMFGVVLSKRKDITYVCLSLTISQFTRTNIEVVQ
ncbi:hypothetical protein LTR09_011367 [Extremus antarcticus]|uniref:Ferric reductase NAD binding domain-containing protein n=1 Tax=Extremus antarcticus TaxID=702011 RepID=A0AAJ0D6E8_9PEZI|nr:hypothetical protein LTR09_011367 [Extremus antarcticus]